MSGEINLYEYKPSKIDKAVWVFKLVAAIVLIVNGVICCRTISEQGIKTTPAIEYLDNTGGNSFEQVAPFEKDFLVNLK